MFEHEKRVLEVLSLFQRPLSIEAILVGAGFVRQPRVTDAIEQLVEDALITRFFDPDTNDYGYALLPVARAFIYSEVSKTDHEKQIRRRLTDYFEARDIIEEKERLVIREIRQGKSSPDAALLDLAIAANRRGDQKGAEELFIQALNRNPQSWKTAAEYAEFNRHILNNHTHAVRLYEQAAANAPRMGADRARIFREWGLLLRDSGDVNSTEDAIEKLEIAFREAPNDPITVTVLAKLYDRKGVYGRVIELLEPFKKHPSEKTRAKSLPLLLKAYDATKDILNAATLRPIVAALRTAAGDF